MALHDVTAPPATKTVDACVAAHEHGHHDAVLADGPRWFRGVSV